MGAYAGEHARRIHFAQSDSRSPSLLINERIAVLTAATVFCSFLT
jgi:hypothetical protein